MTMRWQPALRVSPPYHDDPVYIDALAQSMRAALSKLTFKPDVILASFHGIPRDYFDKGDPYYCHCAKTVRLLRQTLGMNEDQLRLTFQSRFGKAEWLQPTPTRRWRLWRKRGENLAIVTPGFSADCLETLEEIAVENGDIFKAHGGENFAAMPCPQRQRRGHGGDLPYRAAGIAGLGLATAIGPQRQLGTRPMAYRRRAINHLSTINILTPLTNFAGREAGCFRLDAQSAAGRDRRAEGAAFSPLVCGSCRWPRSSRRRAAWRKRRPQLRCRPAIRPMRGCSCRSRKAIRKIRSASASRNSATRGLGAGTTGFDSTNVRANRKIRRPAVVAVPLPPLAPKDQTVAPIYREPVVVRPVPVALPPVYPNSVQQRAPLIRRGPVDEDPFGPLGIRAGGFIWKPAVELTGGYDTNVPRSTERKGSPLWMVAPELQVKSDWSRHEFVLDMRGSYTWYTSLEDFNKPALDLKAKSRIDITSQTRADLEARFNLGADSPGNPNNPSDISKPPIFTTFGGTAGITQRFNRLEVTLKGNVDRTVYQDAELNDGTTLDLTDRNYNQYGVAVRSAYEVSPGIKPFVEAGSDRRVHDQINCFCEDRDSTGRTIKGGMQFELSRKLTGEFSSAR
jgi:hypothetical protein